MTALRDGLTRYLTPAQLDCLARCRVGLVGAGGLGSNVAVMLVRSGLRQLVVADPDRVEPSNLNRQDYTPADLGQLKVEALGRRLLALEPDLDLTGRPILVDQDNFTTIFKNCSVIIEAVDQAATKAMIYEQARQAGQFLVTASGLAGLTGPPLQKRRLGPMVVAVGDFTTGQDERNPPLAPRVIMAAALQAEAVLEHILIDHRAAHED